MSEQPMNGSEYVQPIDNELDMYSIEALRKASQERKAAQQREQQKTSDAILNFHRSFANLPDEEEQPTPAKPEILSINIEVAHISQGLHSKQKPRNEDTVLRHDNQQLFGIFDGMGGHNNGHRASWAAADAVGRYYAAQTDPPTSREEALDRIETAMDNARLGVVQYGGGGGTTAVFGKIEYIKDKPYLVWANAGDSRLFMQEEVEGPIVPISTDQSHGRYVFNGLYGHSTTHSQLQDEFGVLPIEPGARIMFCSDGITGDTPEQALSDSEFEWAFDAPHPEIVTNRLVAASKKRDDKSVLIIDVHDGEERRSGQKGWPNAEAPKVVTGVPPPFYSQPESPRQRMKRHLRRAKEALKAAPAVIGAAALDRYDRAQDYFHEPDKGRRRRRTAAAIAVGAVAVAVAYKLGAFDSIFGGGNPQPPRSVSTQPPIKPPAHGGAPESIVPPSHPPAPPEITKQPTLQLGRQGDTIWGQSAEYLQSHGIKPTNGNVDIVKDAVLRHENLSEFEATHLPVGYQFTVPLEVLDHLHKTK